MISQYEVELDRRVRKATAEEVKDLTKAEQEYIITARKGEQRAIDTGFGGCVFEAEAAAGHQKVAQERAKRIGLNTIE